MPLTVLMDSYSDICIRIYLIDSMKILEHSFVVLLQFVICDDPIVSTVYGMLVNHLHVIMVVHVYCAFSKNRLMLTSVRARAFGVETSLPLLHR